MESPLRSTLSDGTEIAVPVRVSSRCRRIILRSVGDGFEAVVPPGCPPETVRSFFLKNLDWFVKIRRKRETYRKNHPPRAKVLPRQIFLPFTGESFQVEYRPAEVVWTGVRLEGNGILVQGKTEFSPAADGLKKWLIRHAERTLLVHAGEIARDHGFSGLTGLRTGIQRRSWGTCTRGGVVTLNALLLFFTKPLAEYVILHEFCHLTELNHSGRFWRMLESVYPGAKEAREALKSAAELLPAWAQTE